MTPDRAHRFLIIRAVIETAHLEPEVREALLAEMDAIEQELAARHGYMIRTCLSCSRDAECLRCDCCRVHCRCEA